jgi:hypothetical protein
MPGHPVGMDETPLQLSNVVRFELPAYADADALCARLRPRWPGTKTLAGDVWRVSARVQTSKSDLAALLRAVEAYVADAELDAIRYQLDGRFYIMDATPRALAS